MKKLLSTILILIWFISGLFVSYKAISIHNEHSEYIEVTVTSVNERVIPQFRGFRYEYSYDYTVNSTGNRGKRQVNRTEYVETKEGDTKVIWMQDINTWTAEQVLYTIGSFIFLFSILITGINKISK